MTLQEIDVLTYAIPPTGRPHICSNGRPFEPLMLMT